MHDCALGSDLEADASEASSHLTPLLRSGASQQGLRARALPSMCKAIDVEATFGSSAVPSGDHMVS